MFFKKKKKKEEISSILLASSGKALGKVTFEFVEGMAALCST